MAEAFGTQQQFRPHQGRESLQLTQSVVANLYDVPANSLFGGTRGGQRVVFARHVAIYLMHVVFRSSRAEVGRFFGRDRKTVSYAIDKIEDLREDPCFDRQLTALEELLSRASNLTVTL